LLWSTGLRREEAVTLDLDQIRPTTLTALRKVRGDSL
jgi:site-specific recombinase XerD